MIGLLAVIFIASSGQVFAQDKQNKEMLYPFECTILESFYRYGYMDNKAKVVVKCDLEKATCFYEGLGSASKNYKWGFIDRTGKFIIQPQFGAVGCFSNGFVSVLKAGEDSFWGGEIYGYINQQGTFMLPDKYKYAKAGRFSSVDNVLLAPVKAQVDKEKNVWKWCYIDTKGNIKFQTDYYDVSSFSEGLAVVAVGDAYNQKFGYIDKNGNVKLKTEYNRATDFSGGVAAVLKDKEWMLIDQNGNKKAALKMKDKTIMDVGQPSDGMFPVQCADKSKKWTWGIVDTKGTTIAEATYEQVYPFSNGFAPVKKVGSKYWGYIDNKGNYTESQQ